jgi:Uma2 family endonuclease
MTTLHFSTETNSLPTDLWSDEPPLESELHLRQIILLLNCLDWLWQERQDYYAIGNLTIYYSPNQLQKREFCGPDFFVVLNTEKRPRKSWVVWGEGGKFPDVIVEILSDSTAKIDRTQKKALYQNTFRTSEYFWFDPNTLEFQGFRLVNAEYEAIAPNALGHLWSEQLGLYLGLLDRKLRYFKVSGELVPTSEEAALAAQEMANQERQRANQLAQRLRELGIDPDEI